MTPTPRPRPWHTTPPPSQSHTDVGILCRGGDPNSYVVADLVVSWEKSGLFPDERDFTTSVV